MPKLNKDHRKYNLRPTTINISQALLLAINELVQRGFYASNSEAMRHYIKEGLNIDFKKFEIITKGEVNGKDIKAKIIERLLGEFD